MFSSGKNFPEVGVGYLSWDSTSCLLLKVGLECPSSVAGRGFAKVSPPPPPLPLALHLDLARLNPWRNPRGPEGLSRQDFELQNTPERAIKCR